MTRTLDQYIIDGERITGRVVRTDRHDIDIEDGQEITVRICTNEIPKRIVDSSGRLWLLLNPGQSPVAGVSQ